MEQSLSTINLLPSTKEEVQFFVQKVKNEILSGTQSALKYEAQLKAMEEMVKQLRKDEEIKEAVLIEAERYGEKTFDDYGVKFTIRDGGRFQYHQSGDVVYEELMKEKKAIDEKIKNRQDFLKNIPENGIADPEHGNIICVPPKIGETTVSVTLK